MPKVGPLDQSVEPLDKVQSHVPRLLLLRCLSVLLESFSDEIHPVNVAAKRSEDFSLARKQLCPPSVRLQRVLKHKLLNVLGDVQVTRILAEVVVEVTIDPDSSALKPEELIGIDPSTVIIQKAQDTPILTVNPVSVPKGKNRSKEVVVVASSKFRQSHSRELSFVFGCPRLGLLQPVAAATV
jgi:hypothetical protein